MPVTALKGFFCPRRARPETWLRVIRALICSPRVRITRRTSAELSPARHRGSFVSSAVHTYSSPSRPRRAGFPGTARIDYTWAKVTHSLLARLVVPAVLTKQSERNQSQRVAGGNREYHTIQETSSSSLARTRTHAQELCQFPPERWCNTEIHEREEWSWWCWVFICADGLPWG